MHAGSETVKRLFFSAALVVCLIGPVRAPAAYSNASAATDMMNTMWLFMEWFLDGGTPYRNPYGFSGEYGSHWYFPYSGPDRTGLDYWQGAWRYPQVLDGVWLASSGEYWLIRGERFILVTPDGRRFDGGFKREGPFIHVNMARGKREFTYRLWRDLLVMQDINGRTMTLQRVRRPQWNW